MYIFITVAVLLLVFYTSIREMEIDMKQRSLPDSNADVVIRGKRLDLPGRHGALLTEFTFRGEPINVTNQQKN